MASSVATTEHRGARSLGRCAACGHGAIAPRLRSTPSRLMQPGLQLALLVAILLPAGKVVASLFSRVGIPPILGELVVGVMLGPGAVNLLHMHLFQGGEASSALLLMAQVGGLVLMFIAGLETDIDRMREASVTAFLVALSGVIWPFFLGDALGHRLGLSWET